MRLKLAEWSSVAEIVGAFAVVVSYLDQLIEQGIEVTVDIYRTPDVDKGANK